MIRTLCTDAGTYGKHALGRFPEGDGDDPLALREPLARAEEERHAGPAPIVDRAFQRDEGSVSDSGSTPSSDRYPAYCPRTTSFGSIGNMLRNTLFFSSLMGAGSKAVGGSIAMNARIWNRWVTTMSRYAPVAS